jgi:multicomponent Na+:H+ antiporter subunit C
MSLVLVLLIAWLFAIGTYLILQRALTRVVLGITLLGHGAVILLLTEGGRAGRPPLVGKGDSAEAIAAPLPQALALTAIVIGFAMTGFLLALAYRSWLATRDDEVQDDLEDRRIARVVADEEGRYRDANAPTEPDEDTGL